MMANLKHSMILRFGALAVALGIAACGGGGGGDIAGIGSGGTGSYSSGAISGYGSIIVNTVHYDEATATIRDDDGLVLGAQDLKLGMVVEVDGGDIRTEQATGKQRASANRITVRSELIGTISSISGNLVTVLDQQIDVLPTTTFDDATNGVAGLKNGDSIEVYGFARPDGSYAAARIERLAAAPARLKLRGIVTSIDATGRTLNIGAALIDYSGISNPPTLTVGRFVRADLAPARNAGKWVAIALDGRQNQAASAPQGRRVELEGFITEVVSNTRFSVDGVMVNADGVTALPANLARGDRVEVKGVSAGDGSVTATTVKREDGSDDGEPFELEGRVTALDAGSKRFTIRDVVVDYGTVTRYDDGAESDLRDNRKVEVKGTLASDGRTVLADRIKFED